MGAGGGGGGGGGGHYLLIDLHPPTFDTLIFAVTLQQALN